MHVLFVQRQPCIRALKYAEGLADAAHDVRLSFAYENKTLSELYGHGDERFDEWFRLGMRPAEILRDVVATRGVDVIHCHNGPDTLTNICVDLFLGDVPVIHDIHDLMSVRNTAYEDTRPPSRLDSPAVADRDEPGEYAPSKWLEEERRAIECSDAVIAVSTEIVRIVRERGYRLPEAVETYANYIPERYIPPLLPERGGASGTPIRVVYEGSLTSDGGHYDLREIFLAIAREGLELHIYPSRDHAEYARLAEGTPGISYHDHLEPRRLFEQLTAYDYGWAGFNGSLNEAHLDTALPNKLFEYIACGLPVISFPHRALRHFIEAQGVGVVTERVTGLAAVLGSSQASRARERARSQRWDFTVEANIDRVVDVYRRLASGARAV